VCKAFGVDSMNKIRSDLISAIILAGADRQTQAYITNPDTSFAELIEVYRLQKQITKVASENAEIQIQLAMRSRKE
jgi:hypothetical protein